jgi:hypothetical protein
VCHTAMAIAADCAVACLSQMPADDICQQVVLDMARVVLALRWVERSALRQTADFGQRPLTRAEGSLTRDKGSTRRPQLETVASRVLPGHHNNSHAAAA